jgi:hypothetical protein
LLLLFSLLLSTLPANAQGDGWDSFLANCRTEVHDDWIPQIKKGRHWTHRSLENLQGLKDMSQRICPDYLARRNDGAAIATFVAAKQRFPDLSPLIERDGNALLDFLHTTLKSHQAEFAPAGIDFSTGRCGHYMISTTKYMQTRLREIHRSLDELPAKCFRLNAAADAAAQEKALKKAAESANKSQRAPASSGGAAKRDSSDISGVQNALSRDKKLPGAH